MVGHAAAGTRESTVNEAAQPTAEALSKLLTRHYGLAPSRIERLAMGQVTANYRATCPHGDHFVKVYPTGADLAAETAAVALSETAGRVGVPVAAPLRTRAGAHIATEQNLAASVWTWMPGTVDRRGYSRAQQHTVGRVLGLLHATFAELNPQPALRPALRGRRRPAEVRADTDTLLALIRRRRRTDAFDAEAERTLAERRVLLDRVPDLAAALPPLTAQVTHGDFSPMNLLFTGTKLTAVLDFSPPRPALVAYELGRIAFDPRVVTLVDDWPTRSLDLVEAYLTAHPTAAPVDIIACARITVLWLLLSLHGVYEHYHATARHQEDLDAFWLLRHRCAARVLQRLDDIEAALAALASRPPPAPPENPSPESEHPTPKLGTR